MLTDTGADIGAFRPLCFWHNFAFGLLVGDCNRLKLQTGKLPATCVCCAMLVTHSVSAAAVSTPCTLTALLFTLQEASSDYQGGYQQCNVRSEGSCCCCYCCWCAAHVGHLIALLNLG